MTSADLDALAEGLSEAQLKMISRPFSFYIDTCRNQHLLCDAIEMRELGLVTESYVGDDQYTAYRYTPTDLGRDLADHIKDAKYRSKSHD